MSRFQRISFADHSQHPRVSSARLLVQRTKIRRASQFVTDEPHHEAGRNLVADAKKLIPTCLGDGLMELSIDSSKLLLVTTNEAAHC
jgi:hypothetical protein